jgi:hypothetical protein
MNHMLVRNTSAVALILVQSLAYADDLLATGIINESFSGSLNSIGGPAFLVGGQLHLPTGSTLSRVEFSLASFSSNPTLPLPQSLTFSMLYTYPSSAWIDSAGIAFSNIAGVQIGDTVSINPFSVPFNLSNPFLGLFDVYGQRLPVLQGGASWGFGGINATAQAQLSIKAFGTAAPVPEPNAYALMMAGIGLLGWVARRRKAQDCLPGTSTS